MRLSQLLLTVVCASVLAACGGGDDAPADSGSPAADSASANGGTPVTAADVADKYVGTWTLCVPVSVSSSYLVTLTGSKIDATHISYQYSEADFVTNNCSGPSTPDYSESGSIAYQGSKTIGTDVVDKGEATITTDSRSTTTEPRTLKDISLISGSSLFRGDKTSGLDAEGYPNALYKVSGFTKQ